MSGLVETEIHRDPESVDRRLSQLGLTRKGLLTAVAVALQEAANATPFHCANAAGTFAYQHGTWALRSEFSGQGWEPSHAGGVESIWNQALCIRVAFSNVDIACNDHILPKPRSRKGAGAEQVCVGNLFESLPHFTPPPSSKESTYYLMVSENGATELSRPVVSLGTFSSFIERIYLSDGSDITIDLLPLDDGDVADGFDPVIARR